MNIQKNISLKKYNTFGIEAIASLFIEVNTIDDLKQAFKLDEVKQHPVLILGGGSNMLFCDDYKGVVLKMNLLDIEVQEQSDFFLVKAGAGVNWPSFVRFCVERNMAGIENLSLIPGTAGAAPVQNIGAYGVEFKDICYSVEVFEIETGKILNLSCAECKFDYRESIFKSECRNKYVVLSVTVRLFKQQNLKTSYGSIEQELIKRNIQNPTIVDISDVVSFIRVEKLPDPSTIGNAGSFFKNPILSNTKAEAVLKKYPNAVHFKHTNDTVKFAAGWLIEYCGWKGKFIGNVGTWKNQALVIVNNGNATGKEIYDFSSMIINSVKNQFDIDLEREVNIV